MRNLIFCLFIALEFLSPASAQTQRTDMNLVIAIDCSFSVNAAEYALQIGGIAQALVDPAILKAIKDGPRKAIGVSIIQWSTVGNQKLVLPWTKISNVSDAVRAANFVSRMRRQTAQGGTSIVGALNRSRLLLDTAPFVPDRLVIDVIADGENNNGGRVEYTRDALVNRGITINALAVLNEVHYLHHYLRNRVIGGVGAFVERAADYTDFARAFRKKLKREIQGPLFSKLENGTALSVVR